MIMHLQQQRLVLSLKLSLCLELSQHGDSEIQYSVMTQSQQSWGSGVAFQKMSTVFGNMAEASVNISHCHTWDMQTWGWWVLYLQPAPARIQHKIRALWKRAIAPPPHSCWFCLPPHPPTTTAQRIHPLHYSVFLELVAGLIRWQLESANLPA